MYAHISWDRNPNQAACMLCVILQFLLTMLLEVQLSSADQMLPESTIGLVYS